MLRNPELVPVLAGVAVIALVLIANFASSPQIPHVAKPHRPTPVQVEVVPMNAAAKPTPTMAEGRNPRDRTSQAGSTRTGRTTRGMIAGLSQPPAATLCAAPGSALLPAGGEETSPPISVSAATDPASFYPYLVDIRRRLQSAISRDGRLDSQPSGAGRSISEAALWIWIAPTGQVSRAQAPSTTNQTQPVDAKIEQALVEVAMGLGQLPAPPEGLPQPVRVGLKSPELRLGKLQQFIGE